QTMSNVTLFEDNAGGLYLHADGGMIVYETVPGMAAPEDEMAYVADNPDGDPGGWSDEWQHAYDDDWEHALYHDTDIGAHEAVAEWDGKQITVIGVHGGAASDYLNIPSEYQDFGLTPMSIRTLWAVR
ncbi:MAG: hypothetical protein IVW57_12270, partial [Ktedonobacterales bacterium]|nr:hypothetical protein [Ktedonobacterales bacterium]